MTAIRLARAATGRNKIAMFAGSYHGTFDEVLVRGTPAGDRLKSSPIAPGIPARSVEETLVLEYGAAQSLETLARIAHDYAAVLVEPVQSRHPDLQPKEFLQELRRITANTGATLIFDEMITGFRVHPGGAQAHFGIRADIATYGKIAGGGMPIGIIAGRADLMDAIDGGVWSYGDDSYPQADLTFFAGTFCKHPLAMAAAYAVLDHLRKSGPSLQRDLNARTESLVADLRKFLLE
jgi:glutamate-1-semialdehyde aminotransferase